MVHYLVMVAINYYIEKDYSYEILGNLDEWSIFQLKYPIGTGTIG